MFANVSTSPSPPLTAQDIERISRPGKQLELVRGELVVREPPGTWHGGVAANLTHYLEVFVRAHHLGRVFVQDTGFKIQSNPDTVRGPDVAFVGRERLDQIPGSGYAALAPDVVAEVLSPDDRPAEVLAKVADWLGAGSTLVWVIDPRRAEVRVYRADGSLTVVPEQGAIEGEGVLPGFSCLVRDVLG